MERGIVKALVFLLLIINSLADWRKREISLTSLAGFGAAGIGLNLWLGYQSFLEAAGGVGVGLALLAAAFFTREAIGFGDGLLISVTGIYLGFWENMSLLFTGALCCGLILGIGVLTGRVRMTDRVPLVPFLLLAFAGRAVL